MVSSLIVESTRSMLARTERIVSPFADHAEFMVRSTNVRPGFVDVSIAHGEVPGWVRVSLDGTYEVFKHEGRRTHRVEFPNGTPADQVVRKMMDMLTDDGKSQVYIRGDVSLW